MLKNLAFVALITVSAPVFAATTFLHHFDSPLGGAPGDADYAAGNPSTVIGPPAGVGGAIVTGGQFGNALDRTVGGRIAYSTAGNYNPNKGTIEMWIKSADILGGGFVGLWGSDTSSGNTDIRMYIYDVGGVRTLGAYQLGGRTSGNGFWEIEQAIPDALLTDNVWHHVAWAFDCAAGKTATWWDGVLLRNTPDAGTVVPRQTFNNTRFLIGENQTGSAPFPGSIDEFRISDDVVYDTTASFTPPSAPFAIPEPSALGFVAMGCLGLVRRRK
jgi:hypothetical protein